MKTDEFPLLRQDGGGRNTNKKKKNFAKSAISAHDKQKAARNNEGREEKSFAVRMRRKFSLFFHLPCLPH
jgi:hypothetical protein